MYMEKWDGNLWYTGGSGKMTSIVQGTGRSRPMSFSVRVEASR